MKERFIKISALAFAMTLLLTLASCHDTPDMGSAFESNTAETIPTEKQVWLPCTSFDYGENVKYTYYYDEYGNEIKTTKEKANGELSATWFSEYDRNHNLVKKTVDTGDGTPFVQLIQTYDENGNLMERHEFTTSSERIYTYQYDEQNRVLSKSSGQTVEIYTYAEDGSYKVQKVNKPDEYRLYNKDGKMTEEHFGKDSKWVYSYNADGILVELVSYSGNDVAWRMVYYLDEHGNAVKVTYVSSSGEETVLSEYEYQLYTVKVK